jgi:hypothetical protein
MRPPSRLSASVCLVEAQHERGPLGFKARARAHSFPPVVRPVRIPYYLKDRVGLVQLHLRLHAGQSVRTTLCLRLCVRVPMTLSLCVCVCLSACARLSLWERGSGLALMRISENMAPRSSASGACEPPRQSHACCIHAATHEEDTNLAYTETQ